MNSQLKHVEYTPSGVCSKKINFDLDENNKIHNLSFTGGCNGNLKAIARLLEGQDAKTSALILQNNTCGPRNTSCADQLSKAILGSIENK